MTARIAYLTALAGRGGGAMLQPPRRLFPLAGYPDADLGFQHVMTGLLDEDEPRYATPVGPADSQLPGQSQPGGQRRRPTEPILGQRGDRWPTVAGRAELVQHSGTTAVPPRQLDRASTPASVPRASGDPRAPGPRAAAEARPGPHALATLPGGPAGNAPGETTARVARPAASTTSPAAAAARQLDRASTPASVPRASGDPRAPGPRAAAEARPGPHALATLPGGPAGNAPGETTARVARPAASTTSPAAAAARPAAAAAQRVADDADVQTASASAASAHPLPSRAGSDPGPRTARGRPSAMSAAGVGPGYPQAVQGDLQPAGPALTMPASARPGSGPDAVSEAQPAPIRRGRHGLRGADPPHSAPHPVPGASPQPADGPAAMPGGPAERPAGTPADATRDRGRAPQRASAVTVPPAANLEPAPRFSAAARTLDQPEQPAGLAVAPRPPQSAGARGVSAPAKAPVPILSIGTIEVTLIPLRDPVPADTSHREPRRPPQQLNRGLGPRFGQGQT